MATRIRPQVELMEGRTLMTSGVADTTFGGTGYVTAKVGTVWDKPMAIAVQPDLKVVVLGQAEYLTVTGAGSSAVGLVRYNADGSLDPTFGSGGKVSLRFVNANAYDTPEGMAIQPDGKIVLVGSTYIPNGNSPGNDLDIVRLNPNGSFDTTFGGGTGKVLLAQPPSTPVNPYSVLIQSDGKILVQGNQQVSGNSAALVLLRYNTTGTVDTSFGTSGKVVNPSFFASTNQYKHQGSMVIDASGRIDVAGASGTIGTRAMSVIRYNPNGAVDTTFGRGGVASAAVPGFTNWVQGDSLALQSTGKIVVTADGPTSNPGVKNLELIVARFNTDGSLDDGSAQDTTSGDKFGNAGIFLEPRVGWQWCSVGVEADDKLVVLGRNWVTPSSTARMALTRILADGSSSDVTFGQNGVTQVNFGSTGGDWPAQLVIAPDGKFVVTGNLGLPDAQTGMAAARFLSDPVPPAPLFLPAPTISPAPPATQPDPTTVPLVLDDPSLMEPLPVGRRRRAV